MLQNCAIFYHFVNINKKSKFLGILSFVVFWFFHHWQGSIASVAKNCFSTWLLSCSKAVMSRSVMIILSTFLINSGSPSWKAKRTKKHTLREEIIEYTTPLRHAMSYKSSCSTKGYSYSTFEVVDKTLSKYYLFLWSLPFVNFEKI